MNQMEFSQFAVEFPVSLDLTIRTVNNLDKVKFYLDNSLQYDSTYSSKNENNFFRVHFIPQKTDASKTLSASIIAFDISGNSTEFKTNFSIGAEGNPINEYQVSLVGDELYDVDNHQVYPSGATGHTNNIQLLEGGMISSYLNHTLFNYTIFTPSNFNNITTDAAIIFATDATKNPNALPMDRGEIWPVKGETYGFKTSTNKLGLIYIQNVGSNPSTISFTLKM
jgi:hypothetical protein